MRRVTLRKALDLFLYLLFCVLAATGLLMHFRLVHGSPGRGMTVFGLDRHDWGSLHAWVSYAFLAAVALHFLMNAMFIKKVIARQTTWRWAVLLAGGVFVVVVLLMAPIRVEPGAARHGGGGGWGHRAQGATYP